MKIATVIMAGGSGKRFWPLSRERKAKQSLNLFSDHTLLVETIERIKPVSQDVTIITSLKQRDAIESDVWNYPHLKVIYEPSGRNTAPCIMLALHSIKKRFGEDCAVLVLPADHYIKDPDKFVDLVKKGVSYLEKNPETIGTIGIEPTRPETGYGYIRKGDVVEKGVFSVKTFEEKPEIEKAQKFIESGEYLWNGGIFLFSMNSMIEEFRNSNKDIHDKVVQLENTENIDKDFYNSIRSISFDYAVMETTKKPVFTVAGEFGWNDIGSWRSYYELLEKDENGNYSKGDVHFVNCKNSMVINLSGKPVVIFNKEGELFVDAGDVVLSAKLNDHQAIREVTEYLKESSLLNLL